MGCRACSSGPSFRGKVADAEKRGSVVTANMAGKGRAKGFGKHCQGFKCNALSHPHDESVLFYPRRITVLTVWLLPVIMGNRFFNNTTEYHTWLSNGSRVNGDELG